MGYFFFYVQLEVAARTGSGFHYTPFHLLYSLIMKNSDVLRKIIYFWQMIGCIVFATVLTACSEEV
jgi:hypothetical protein